MITTDGLGGEQGPVGPNFEETTTGMLTQLRYGEWGGMPFEVRWELMESVLQRAVALDAPEAEVREHADVLRYSFRAAEYDYPDAREVDAVRQAWVAMLYTTGHSEAMLATAADLSSEYTMAEVVLTVIHDEEGLEKYADALGHKVTSGQFLQACIDIGIIDGVPALSDPAIVALEEKLRARDFAYDPIGAWVEFQQRLYPEVDLQGLESMLRDEEAWRGTSDDLITRRRVMDIYVRGLRLMADDDIRETAKGLASYLSGMQEAHPMASIWDMLRRDAALYMLNAAYPELALQYGEQMQSSEEQAAIVGRLIHTGSEAHAMALTLKMTDLKTMVEMLVRADWHEYDGAKVLYGVVDGSEPDQSVERRIGCLDVIIEDLEAFEREDPLSVKHYREMRSALLAEQAALSEKPE